MAWLAIDSIHLHRQMRVLAEHESQFAIQYSLWLLLLWPQWKAYDTLVRWCRGHPYREAALRLAALSIALAGCVWAYQSWEPSHRVGLFFIDRLFWVVRAIGLGLSGIVVLLYGHLAQVRLSRVKQTSRTH